MEYTEDLDKSRTRDERFKRIIEKQIGPKGVPLLVNQACLFLIALVMVVSILIGVISSKGSQGPCGLQLKYPIIVPADTEFIKI